ncbi:septum formation family protein [Planosporangium sp. 12N6]|uniref:septum formation family protein n=1 Tax=Planosporangium spinosum TaxID=3402278 RepID=UPI003CEA3524
MRKPLIALTVFAIVAALVAGGFYWLTRPEKVSAQRPAGAPATGTCWNVSEQAAVTAFPWPGSPVDCTAPHTAEVFLVGQVDRELAAKAARAKGDDAKLQQNLMYAEARHGCTVFARQYLGGDWRSARTQIIANWIKPAKSGFFGCAVVQSAAPASKRFIGRTASLRGALGTDELAIRCVARDGGGEMAYAPCEQPHDGEFVGTYTITPPGAPFDKEKVAAAALSGCGGLVNTYVGGARTELRAGYVGPTSAGDWLGSDQTFACYALVIGDDKLRGSVKGIGTGPLPR